MLARYKIVFVSIVHKDVQLQILLNLKDRFTNVSAWLLIHITKIGRHLLQLLVVMHLCEIIDLRLQLVDALGLMRTLNRQLTDLGQLECLETAKLLFMINTL